jgi:transcriptional regulator with XRE-family HTH domain
MPESFGARLRGQRERQQIPLAAIAEQTKIKVSLLEELERDDVSHWPSGIFRRAFIRAYAAAIGLDQDAIVREFLELHPDPIEVIETLPLVAPRGDAAGASPPMRFQYFVDAAIDSLSRLRREVVQRRGSGVETAAPAGAGLEAQAADADLLAAARLCTEFGRLEDPAQAGPLLQEVAELLEAIGLIVWVWEDTELKPVLAHGYSEKVLAQLPRVDRDADNATAAAFRSAQACVVGGSDRANGALVVPLVTPAGCSGVLAIELKQGSEQRPAVRALATIVAAQLARLVDPKRPAAAADRRLA